MWLLSLLNNNQTLSIGVGFGTAALGASGYDSVQWALAAGFRQFDTAEEHEHWYDSASVGRAVHDYFTAVHSNSSTTTTSTTNTGVGRTMLTTTCADAKLRISTKIPPWRLTSQADIRRHARDSQQQLTGFCTQLRNKENENENKENENENKENVENIEVDRDEEYVFPLDVYYIHAPQCWPGWHPRCSHDRVPTQLLSLHEAWLAMEAVVGLDHSSSRIGVSNVRPQELLDLIAFVKQRQEQYHHQQQEEEPEATSRILAKTNATTHHSATAAALNVAPPRMPDAVQAYADPIEPNEELINICLQHGIEFVSYSTLGTQHKYKGRHLDENPVLTHPTIERIAAKHQDRSAAEVVLSWAMHKGMSVIPRSSQKQHIHELSRLLHLDPMFLDAQDIHDIDSMKHSL